MRVVIAPDSFKGSLKALEVANAIEKGIKRISPCTETVKVPMADGGEGTVESLVDATKGEIVHKEVTGPLGKKVKAFYGILGDDITAVIEMASASGLNLVQEKERNPMVTTTYGTGELIKYALDKGCRKFIIGIGGSATNDGGAGMAQALGARLLNEKHKDIGFGGKALKDLNKIDISTMDNRLNECEFVVACDVDNPLYGINGASYVYGPQKGATEEMVKKLDNNLRHFATIVEKNFKKDISHIKGAGAAGGLGGGLVAFLGAKLKSGIDIVIERTKLSEEVKKSNLVITGEGKIDNQTIHGKTPIGVAKLAKQYNVPVIALAGCISDDGFINHEYGIDSMFSIINYPIKINEALNKEKSSFFIEKNTEEIFRIIKLGLKI